ncbi:MAG: leucine-rich repeat protein [Lentisphaerae bacterium]|nr:leucine-rich repeat protein [Lentisphaerota bacterium]
MFLGQVERDTGFKVIRVGNNAFQGNSKLLSFIGPDVVETGSSSFQKSSITNATLSPAFHTFGGSDFDYCKSINSFWPSTMTNLTNMAKSAFCNSTVTGDFVLPIATNIGDSAFSYTRITSLIATNCTSVGSEAMRSCTALHTVVLSDNLETMGGYVFYSAFALREFSPRTMPRLTAMPNNAFTACSKLYGDFVLPIATSIGDTAFRNTQIDSIVATNCTSVGTDAFRYCNYILHSLTNAVFSPDISHIGNAAFDMDKKLVSFFPTNMPGIASLGSIFCSCDGALKLAFLFPNLTTFNGSTFQSCSGIPFVSAPRCTSIGGNTFYNCTGLAGVELPELEYIGVGAFRNCKALTNEIVLTGSTLTSIPAYAFQTCGKIARVTIKAPNITSLGTEAFCYGPTPPIYWNTTVQPAISFGTRAIAGGANATTADPYPYVHAMTSVAAYGWEQYYTPVSQLTDTQKARSDYPGKRTLGLVSIPPADTGSVFWIVDDRIHRTMLIVR